jgi:hypothetical protein
MFRYYSYETQNIYFLLHSYEFFNVVCDPDPKIVFCDGLHFSFKSKGLHPHLQTPTALAPGVSRIEPQRRGPCNVKVSFYEKKVRDVLHRIFQPSASASASAPRIASLSASDMAVLDPSTLDFLLRMTRMDSTQLQPHSTLIKALAKRTTCTQFMHSELSCNNVMEIIRLQPVSVTQINEIKRFAPLIWNILNVWRMPDGQFPDEVGTLQSTVPDEVGTLQFTVPDEVGTFLCNLAIRIQSVWSQLNHESSLNQPACFQSYYQSVSHPKSSEYQYHGVYCGEKSRIRFMRDHPQDSVKVELEEPDHNDENRDPPICTKKYRKGCNQTGGCMVAWCKHSIALAFCIMPIGEGVRDVAALLYAFWRDAPEVVYYDNACALAQFAITREPEFFRKTMFIVDQLHWANHTSCNVAFASATYRSSENEIFRQVNDAAAESGNSGLAKFKTQAKYMHQVTFMHHARLVLSIQNRCRILTIQKKHARNI